MKRCSFVTFGCKINQYDTQAIRESVLELGYQEVAAGEQSDLIIVNSCTVTNTAGEKGVAAVRRLSKAHPDAQLIVTGCLAPEDHIALAKIDGVDTIVGNEEKDQIPALLTGHELERISGRRSRNIFNLSTRSFSGRVRAFLKVHDGCDDFCSYCIIPFMRGKTKSRERSHVIAEARRLAEGGYKELVITGIHLRQYGLDLGDKSGLLSMLDELRQIPGIDRVRLSSIGLGAFSDQFLQAFAGDDGLCPFFHIPLQSGSDAVLKRMRRDYTGDAYVAVTQRIFEALPNATISTDLMVGFPGESDADFEQSLAVCKSAQLSGIHIFPYSRRTNTRAATMPDQVDAKVKLRRVQDARNLLRELQIVDGRRWQGRKARVLVERVHSLQQTGAVLASGLSREGLRVEFMSSSQDDVKRNQEYFILLEDSDGPLHRGILLR